VSLNCLQTAILYLPCFPSNITWIKHAGQLSPGCALRRCLTQPAMTSR
jgi:hypothetical protein